MTNFDKRMMLSLAAIMALSSFSNIAVSKGKPEPGNQKPNKQWFLRTKVSVDDNDITYKGINEAVLGQLTECKQTCPQHIIKPFNSLASSHNVKAAVVFILDGSIESFADYHGFKQSDIWELTVLAAKGGDVTLSWDGAALTSTKEKDRAPLYKETPLRKDDWKGLDLSVIDLKTLEVIPMEIFEGHYNSYTFTMDTDETARLFRIVKGPINASQFDPASGALQYIKEHQPHVLRQRRSVKQVGKFGLPPN